MEIVWQGNVYRFSCHSEENGVLTLHLIFVGSAQRRQSDSSTKDYEKLARKVKKEGEWKLLKTVEFFPASSDPQAVFYRR
ncbi:MAG TPA: hypothetical protein PKK07_00365 [bacterium]|jgi:hypothetical protein|nr:hypothetical protein [bacterium]HOA18311.1 hypothetical protein [bacterium]